MENNNNIDELCKNIFKEIKKNSDFVQMSYYSLNHLNFKFSFLENIDCVFSSMIFLEKKTYIEDNNQLISNDLWNPYSTAPLYIFSSSFLEEDKTIIMISNHSPDITPTEI